MITTHSLPLLSFSKQTFHFESDVPSSSAVSSSVNSAPSDLTLFSGFGNNIVNSFKGNNLYLHLAGVASTFILVTTNTDYQVHKYFNEHEQFSNAARPVIHWAMYFPFVIGGSLYAYGKLKHDDEAMGASFAVCQSSLIALSYNSLLKAITGRPNPNWRNNQDMEELSKTFRFGFLRGGIFWGWPSSHTSSTMAVVSALTNFYPDKTWLKIAGYGYVGYMVFAVSSLGRGGMHWFSDAVAAAFMSYAIGSTTGKFYRNKFKKTTDSQTNTQEVMPNVPLFAFSINF
ncbi:MAG: phosphatase PAP2 family protein [Ignavibacteria bacterium]|nr:phosphatase PAP2 family protein [Ignavibacteria bacterium]